MSSKDYLKAHPDRFESARVSERVLRVSTGGTTGDPLAFLTTRRAQQEQWAIWWRFRILHGLTTAVTAGHFGGQPVVPSSTAKAPFWRDNRAGNLVYFSPIHLSETTAPAYVEEINRRKLVWLHGYPTVLANLASYILDRGLQLHDALTWVTTGAEGLTAEDRALMSKAFGARVRQHYGLAEAAANISECGRGVLHVDEDHSLVEFLPDNDVGALRIVGTAFSNSATAFVRYDTGDFVTMRGRQCDCGLPGRAVASIEGRETDFIRLSSGALLGPVNQIAKWLPGVRHLQLVDHGNDSITALVVPRGASCTNDDSTVEGEIMKRSPVPIHLRVRRIHSPVRTAGGKILSILRENAAT